MIIMKENLFLVPKIKIQVQRQKKKLQNITFWKFTITI